MQVRCEICLKPDEVAQPVLMHVCQACITERAVVKVGRDVFNTTTRRNGTVIADKGEEWLVAPNPQRTGRADYFLEHWPKNQCVVPDDGVPIL